MNLGSFQKRTKYILLAVISIFIIVVTIFLGKGASEYFASASDCPGDEENQGRLEYGTNSVSLTFNSPEPAAQTRHTLPLTLLTPNTIYYYLVSVGNIRCDSSGQKCEGESCVPYSFTTASIGIPEGTVETIPTRSASPSAEGKDSPAPTSSLTLFCKAVQANIGKNSSVAAEWASIKTYDIDGNGIINGLDVVKCQKSGK
ncbi:MAG: hypothetical protein UV46_C0078G0003 [Candidatus Gottesmanbacteria bacterium GW2011_GWC2_42_8]|nr:MAG: hypothetical protein UV46_C0078G0003 [Candidatus Gottesmanbacteria bacterium GW2011_GWC2_42_8]